MSNWYKIEQFGSTTVVAIFFNVVTKEERLLIVKDIFSDNERLKKYYEMPISEEAVIEWKHSKGVLLQGDVVEVVRGRKVPKGIRCTITDTYPIYNKYDKQIGTYVVLDNYWHTNIKNVQLVA